VRNELDSIVDGFIAEHVHSVEQLEVLLLLERSCPKAWNAEQVATEIRTSRSSAQVRLEDLTARGLLVVHDPDDPSGVAYRYGPVSSELADMVVRLGSEYGERRFSVIRAIFAKPPERVSAMRAFADAFRLRKKGP